MKNFSGRIIVLICGVANVVLFLVMIGTFIFYSLSDPSAVAAFFTGGLASHYYISIGLVSLVIILYLYLTIHSLISITKGKVMKKDMFVAVFVFVALLASFIFNVMTTPEYSLYYAFFYGIEIALMLTTSGMFAGSFLNYHKDCK